MPAVLAGNNAVVVKFEGSGTKFRLIQVSAFKQWFSNQWVNVGEKAVKLGDYWLDHSQRRQYEGIEFVPGVTRNPATTIFGRGSRFSRSKVAVREFIAHMRNNVARGG
jgi:hypothetical protein